MPSNNAAWLTGETAFPLQVKPAPYYAPKQGELLVKTHAVAINPCDHHIQYTNTLPTPYPLIPGADLAGTIVEVGPGGTSFAVGDRILAYAIFLGTHDTANSAFQEYVLVRENFASVIPDNVSFERATVLPLAVATASSALFGAGNLELRLPSLVDQTPRNQSVLIWGGASSVGSAAVQLARAAGYHIISTASSKNHGFVKGLGAAQMFDYKAPDVVDQIISALEGKGLVGVYDASGQVDAVRKVAKVAVAKGVFTVITARQAPDDLPAGVKAIWATSLELIGSPLAKTIYGGFVPKALEQGGLEAVPEPRVVGHGLECVQGAIDTWKKGVSAEKIVVML